MTTHTPPQAEDPRRPVCAVVGVGPGNGAAIARRFGAEGFAVALLARSTAFSDSIAPGLPGARSYACDVRDGDAIASTFANIARDLGAPEVVVYNAASGVWGSIEEISAADFEESWRVNALGLLHVAKHAAPPMKRAGRGALVVVGATASRRGQPKTAAFAPAKAAQRSLAESMAKALWPAGVHVALVIVDGVVDRPPTRERMPGKPDEVFVSPDGVADTVWWLARQHRSAWAFEVEARPYGETW